jgi:aspartyl-tRNA(Asn)/glutamyl-tRNA(Gln) amidotransferase subunit A
MLDLLQLSARELLDHYRAGALSPVEAVKACLERIGALDDRFNAMCLVDAAGAMDTARASEARWRRKEPQGLIDGVPVTIKDLFAVRDWPLRSGSKTTAGDPPPSEDAPAVARLREHGGVFLGKTTTTEFGHKGVGDSPLTGITRNPWNPALTPGGSSAGAAVSACAGYAPLNLGSDGGGSLRIPASFSGVFGFKPGLGRVPALPSSGGPLVADGSLTRFVGDAALMLEVIAGQDIRDPYAYFAGQHDFRSALDAGLEGRKLAYARTISNATVDPEVAASVESAVGVLRDLGAVVEPVDLDLPDAPQVYLTINGGAMAAALADAADRHGEIMDIGLVNLIARGKRTSAPDYVRAFHVARSAFAATLRSVHAAFDLLVLPTMPIEAFAVGLDYPGEQDGVWRADWTPFTFPFNLAALPACSIPCGLTSRRLPVGLQFVGPVAGELGVLQAARAFESTYRCERPEFDT